MAEFQHCWHLSIFIILFTITIRTAESQTSVANLSPELYRKLQDADFDDKPPNIDNATLVDVDFFLNGISNVQATSMDYWIDVYLTETWVDKRLQENGSIDQFISLPESFIPKLWTPDVFFTKAKEGRIHTVTNPNIVLKLNPNNGTLLFAQRIRAKLGCTMNLKHFPFDSQKCQILMHSWRYDVDLLKLRWMAGGYDSLDNPVVDKRLSASLPSLGVDTKYFVGGCEIKDANRGTFSCLRYFITFYRTLSFYVWDIYVPSTLMVVVTWMSFWIDRKIIQGRCALGSLTMVAISNQINSVKSVLPRTAQTKAADVWLWACQFYVLAAFLEFGLVNWLSRRDMAIIRRRDEALAKEQEEAALAAGEEVAPEVKKEEEEEEEMTQEEKEEIILSMYQEKGGDSSDEEYSSSESEYEEEEIEEIIEEGEDGIEVISRVTSILSPAEKKLSRGSRVSFAANDSGSFKAPAQQRISSNRVSFAANDSGSFKAPAQQGISSDGFLQVPRLGTLTSKTRLSSIDEPIEEPACADQIEIIAVPSASDGEENGVPHLKTSGGNGVDNPAVVNEDGKAMEMKQVRPSRPTYRRITIRKSKIPQTRLQRIMRTTRKGWGRFCRTGRAKRIDIMSRGIFPGSFLIFAIVYWAQYLSVSNYYEYQNRDT